MRPIRISFDVDDTLVRVPAFPTDRPLPIWNRWRYREPLRRGTSGLMQELIRRDCRVWIYTTSYRPLPYLRGWLRAHGIAIEGAVNQERHDQIVGRQGPSKYPPAFGIDLHVDDSSGVALEGKRHGFEVVVVSPDDPDWATIILEAVASLRPQAILARAPAPRAVDTPRPPGSA